MAVMDRGHLLTEAGNPRSVGIDSMGTAEAFDVINAEDAGIAAAVAAGRAEICAAVDLVVRAFERGGRLIYVGAGTSGRLGVLDASECPPTFLTDPAMVVGVIAGGAEALRRSIEGAEDDPSAAEAEMDKLGVGASDVVFGIATGGTTPYVHAAIARGKELGAATVFFACVSREHVGDAADVSIRVLVGPEVITGSTRMKAGTATKLVLNMVTTLSMVRIGKVYRNLMVDLNTRANAKLVDRGTRVVMAVTGLDRASAGKLLERAEGRVKAALVMQARGVSLAEANRMLLEAKGRLAGVLDDSVIDQPAGTRSDLE
jgi:N-acetylmuramic acid 6-phosphate etherase